MKRNLRVGLAVLLALLIALQMVITVSASPPAPGDKLPLTPNENVTPAQPNIKPIDQPNVKDFQRNQARMRLLKSGNRAAADALSLTADDKVLVIMVEYAGTDTFTWNPGDQWDPYGRADTSEAVLDASGAAVGWVEVPHSTWYYGADQCPGARSTSGGVSNSGAIPGAGGKRQLVRDALDAVNAANPSFDWAQHDQNGDGIIDRLWIVHSGYGEEDGTVLLNRTDYGESAIWSHSSAVTPAYPVAPGVAAGPYICKISVTLSL